MKPEKIKPIPKYIQKLIYKEDLKRHPDQKGFLRFYAYLTRNDGELVKITVAVRNRYKKWHCKQVAMHGIHSDKSWVKDMIFHYIAGYKVGWFYEGLSKYKNWYESQEWGWGEDKMFDPYAPIVNIDYLTKYPEYKYSAYELYKGVDIFRYLRVYEEHPGVEMLVKIGLEEYTHNSTIIKKCEQDKSFRKWLFKNAEALRIRRYYVQAVLFAYNRKMDLDEAQSRERIKKSLMSKDYKAIREAISKDYFGFSEYIKAQNISYYQYKDYAEACLYLGLDMTLAKNRYPHEFRKWHDIRTDQYATAKALERMEKEKEFAAQFAAVAEKYLPLQKNGKDDYIIIIAKTPAELVKEGSSLHHCVGRMNYDQKMVREETLIFFIRRKSAPEIPLATLEYSLSKKKVVQCYGDHDTKPEDDITSFVYNKWLPYANRKLNKIAA